jgi:hypothetical protein
MKPFCVHNLAIALAGKEVNMRHRDDERFGSASCGQMLLALAFVVAMFIVPRLFTTSHSSHVETMRPLRVNATATSATSSDRGQEFEPPPYEPDPPEYEPEPPPYEPDLPEPYPYFYVVTDSHIRSGPGTNYRVLRVAKAGELVDIRGCDNDDCAWFRLTNDEWVASHLVEEEFGIPELDRQLQIDASSESVEDAEREYREEIATEVELNNRAAAAEREDMQVENSPNCIGGCTEYPTWCEPPIKGNVSFNGDEKIYHVPGQAYYDETTIDTRYGERWFCTEDEARAAGWRRSKR